MDPELTEQLNESMRNLAEMMAQLNSTMAGTVKSMQNTTTANKNAAAATQQTANQQNESSNRVISSQTKLAEAHSKADQMIAQSAKNLNDALFSSGQAVKSFAAAVLSGEEGFKKYGSAVGSVGNAALSLGSNFGKLGLVAGLVTKAFTSVAELGFKQADNLLSASDSISKLGAANAFSTESIRQIGQGAGLASWELEKLIKPMQSVSGGFLGLAGSQAEGIKRFGEMTNVTVKTRQEFQRLGFNDQERIQAQSDFISMMNKSGAAFSGSMKTQAGLQKASLEYTTNLVELAAITGTDVETAKQQREIQMATMEVALQQNKWEQDLIRAEKEHDGATKERIEKERRGFEQFNNDLKQAGLNQDQITLAQNRFLTGAITSAQGAQFEMRGTDLDEFIRKAKEGTLKQGELAESLKQGANTTLREIGHSVVGMSEEVQKAFGFNKEFIGKSTQLMGDNLATVAGQASAAIKANAEGKGPVAEDPAHQARNALTEAERRAKFKVDDLVASMNPLLGPTGAMKLLAAGASAAAIALGAVGIGKLIGGLKDILGERLGKLGSKGNPMHVTMDGIPGVGGLEKNKAGKTAKGSKGKLASAALEDQLLSKSGKPLTGAARAGRAAKLAREAALAEEAVAGSVGKVGKLGKVLGGFGKLMGPLAAVGALTTGISEFANVSAREKSGELTAEEASAQKKEAVGGSAGGILGGLGGAELGAILGSFIAPGIGTAIGGALGALLGGSMGEGIGRIVSKHFKSLLDIAVFPLTTALAPVAAVAVVIKDNWDNLVSITKHVIGILGDAVKIAFFPIYWTGKKVAEMFEWLWKKAEPVTSKLIPLWDMLRNAIKTGIGWLSDFFTTVHKWTSGIVSWLYGEDKTKENAEKPKQEKKPEETKKPTQDKTKKEPVAQAPSLSPEALAALESNAGGQVDLGNVDAFNTSIDAFNSGISSYGKITTAFATTIGAYATTTGALARSIKAFADTTKSLIHTLHTSRIHRQPASRKDTHEMMKMIGLRKPRTNQFGTEESVKKFNDSISLYDTLVEKDESTTDLYRKSTDSFFNSNVLFTDSRIAFASTVTSFATTVTAFATTVTAFATTVIALKDYLAKIAGTVATPSPYGKPSVPTAQITPDARKNLDVIAKTLRDSGFNDENYVNAVLGNIMKETGGQNISENLDYSKTDNQRIRSLFGDRTKGLSDAELDKIKATPQSMAEFVYGGRMGNKKPGDAWTYRGRGFIQLTGKANYAEASKDIYGDDRLVQNPDLVLEPAVGAQIVAWFMHKNEKSMRNKLNLSKNDLLSKQEAALLATSQIAGKAITRGSGYLGTENLSKVESYASSMPSTLSGASQETPPDDTASPLAKITQNADIVSLGKMLQQQGITVSEHSQFGGVTKNGHKGRAHYEDRALDLNIVPGRDADNPRAAAIFDDLKPKLMQQGYSVLWKVGGHFDHMHVQKGADGIKAGTSGVVAAKGGVFTGSKQGYPATLHGTEMVAPLQVDSILMKLAKTSANSEEGEMLGRSLNKTVSPVNAEPKQTTDLVNMEVLNVLSNKLDTMINILEDGNYTRHKILQHSLL